MKYLLLGMGKSNQSVERFFQKNKIEYVKYDDKTCVIDIDINEVDVIVKTPGMRNDHFLLNNSKLVITDLELFYQMQLNKNFITVTGSNGKTTTVKLLKHLIKDIDLGGNVGFPVFDFIDSSKDIIIEASSFMLEYIVNFRSKYNVLLNLFCTHLEHHKNFSRYVESKMNLLKNVRDSDYIIYNYDDKLLKELVKEFPGKKIPFSRTEKIGVHLENNYIVYQGQMIDNINNISLIGDHNIDNVLAAIAVILHYRGDIIDISSFTGVEYRLEYVTSFNGVDVYNDSKSTNFNALASAIKSFNKKSLILIAGGQKQDHDFSIFNDFSNIKACYFFGENRLDMYKAFNNHISNCYVYSNLEDVFLNIRLEDCDVLLFSPGCISYDQFKSYIKRGEVFNQLLENYIKNISIINR